MPPSTFGMCLASTYVRCPGRETRFRPEIAERRSFVYFRRNSDHLAGGAVGSGRHGPVFDVALLGENARHLTLELGGGHLDGLVRGVDRVADSREEVSYRVGH
jgi:hypothetical protein